MTYKEIIHPPSFTIKEEPPQCDNCIEANIPHKITAIRGLDGTYSCSGCDGSFYRYSYFPDREWSPE